jgi:hypothetical protein
MGVGAGSGLGEFGLEPRSKKIHPRVQTVSAARANASQIALLVPVMFLPRMFLSVAVLKHPPM